MQSYGHIWKREKRDEKTVQKKATDFASSVAFF